MPWFLAQNRPELTASSPCLQRVTATGVPGTSQKAAPKRKGNPNLPAVVSSTLGSNTSPCYPFSALAAAVLPPS